MPGAGQSNIEAQAMGAQMDCRRVELTRWHPLCTGIGAVEEFSTPDDWQFYDWSSNLLTNPTDHNIHVNGSLVWIWFLTGHPQIFPNAPEFLTDGALFSFETFVVPGTNGGWDAAWLAPAKSGTFSSVPDKIDDSGSSPLSRLLAMDQNGVLRLWFAMDFRNPQVNEAGLSGSHGWTIDGGPDTLYYTYAYSSPRLIDLSYTHAYSSPRLIDLSPREPLLVG